MPTLRRTRGELASPSHALSGGLSLERRPDAVAWDGRTSYTPGPAQAGDSSAGLLERAWRARATDTAVLLSRAAPGGAGWEAETTLFSYAGAPVTEVDLAWDQNARPVVCAERATGPGGAAEVWLYWFDPQPSAFVFTSMGAGRTPRIVLDDPEDAAASDLLLFYCADPAGCVAYRQQRDRYAVQIATPLAPVANLFLERAVRTRGGRVRLVYSARDAAAGTYTLSAMESTLYPVRLHDGLRAGVALSGGLLEIAHARLETATFTAGSALRTGTLRDVVQRNTLGTDGLLTAGHAVTGGTIQEVVQRDTLDTDALFTAGHAVGAEGTLVRVVLRNTLDPSAATVGHSLVTGSLTNA